MIKRLDHVHVVSKNMNESINFYTKVLGFKLLRHVRFGPSDDRQLSYVGLGDMMIELVQPAHDDEFKGTESRPIGLSVDNLDEATKQFKAAGIEVVNEPTRGFSFGGRQAVIRDPSGLAIEVRQWDLSDNPMSPNWQPWREDVTKIA